MRPARLLRSTTFRLALIYLGLFSASVLVLLVFIDWSTAGFMRRQTDAVIEAEIRGLAEQFDQRGTAGLVQAVNRRAANARATRGLYLVAGSGNNRVAGNLSGWPDAAPDEQGWITFPVEYGAAQPGRSVDNDIGRARVFQLGGGFRLLVGRDIRERLEIATQIRRALAWGLAIMLVLSMGGGLLLSRTMLGQIDTINETSRRIITGDLRQRVPVRGSGDEFDQLARNLNAMLDKIEQLLDGMKQVTDNISHDLRSPLTRLRSRLEVALMQAPDTERYKRAMQKTIEETDQLLRTFNALLRISYAESGAARRGFAPVDMKALVDAVAEFYGPLAEDKGHRCVCTVETEASVPGDRDLLFQAVANLVENALKYSPAGGIVFLSLRRDDAGYTVRVADEGPGIAREARDEVLRRFHRLDDSRQSPGSGLGLSLVAAVAKLHDAELVLSDNRPGLIVEMRFGFEAPA